MHEEAKCIQTYQLQRTDSGTRLPFPGWQLNYFAGDAASPTAEGPLRALDHVAAPARRLAWRHHTVTRSELGVEEGSIRCMADLRLSAVHGRDQSGTRYPLRSKE